MLMTLRTEFRNVGWDCWNVGGWCRFEIEAQIHRDGDVMFAFPTGMLGGMMIGNAMASHDHYGEAVL